MTIRIAAALAVAVLLVMALVAFLTLHRPPTGYVPAAPGSDVRAYQTLVERDYATTVASTSNHCNTIQDAGCKSAYEKVRANLETWLTDMNNSKPPPRFKQIDTMLKHHLAQAIVEGDAGIAAQQAGNSTLFDTAFTAHDNERGLVDEVDGAVANTVVVTASNYKSTVQNQLAQYSTCTPCSTYAGPTAVNCSGAQLYNCVDDAVAVDAQIFNFETTVVQNGSPSSLATHDTTLQTDLVNADAALMAMIKAGLSSDLAGFNAARGSLQISISAVNLDVGAVSKA